MLASRQPRGGRRARVAACAALLAFALPAAAYGPAGHRIAGLIAAPLLCADARAGIAALAGGERFEDLGLWADRIRDDERFAHTGPWHYMNVDDGRALAEYRTPRTGDVLAAIARFERELADRSRPPAVRAEALKFLVHFVVDVHQPLHVGRAADRGGNTIDVRYGRTTVSLHRFWDTDVIRRRGLSDAAYAARLADAVRAARAEPVGEPREWAEESLALREAVYGFDPRSGVLSREYLARAERVTERRLAQAGVRLAATLNGIFCRQ